MPSPSPWNSPAHPGSGPLAGLRVVDFTRVLSGPFSTALLADLGAEVVKIESPEGDDYRHIGPFIDGTSALFAFANRGKKSVVLDLKQPDDLAAALALVAEADVVVENFRPGVAARLGLGHDKLMAQHERLVYASISGFGQTSPLRERPAYDLVVQALTGLMSVNGHADGPPTIVGDSFGDLTAGLFASWAILAALVQRGSTGKGCHLDVAMFDSLLTLMPTAVGRYFATGQAPTRSGNRHPFSAPFGAFAARDGNVVIAILNNRLFEALMGLIGHPAMAADPRFAHDEQRGQHEAALRAPIEQWTAQRSVAEVVQALSAAGIPCAAIDDVATAVDSAQATSRQLFRSGQVGEHAMRLPEQPVHFSTMVRGSAARVPTLGEHTALFVPARAANADAFGA